MSWLDDLPPAERAVLEDAGRIGMGRFEEPSKPKTHDWRPVSGLIHAYPQRANLEIENARRHSPDFRYRVAYIATGYMVQVRVPRQRERKIER